MNLYHAARDAPHRPSIGQPDGLRHPLLMALKAPMRPLPASRRGTGLRPARFNHGLPSIKETTMALQSLPADALALRDLRLANPHPLSAPPVLTPTLRAKLAPYTGYAFTWGQLIEQPGDLPDPDTENYTGTRWSILPVGLWQALHPSLRATGRHLYHLLDIESYDSADCVECALPSFVYLDAQQGVSPFGFVTLSGADAAQARRWLVDSFLVDELPGVLARYEAQLSSCVDEFRQDREDRMAARGRQGDRP